MDLSRMLSSEKRDDFTPPISQPHVVPATPPKRARLDPTLQHPSLAPFDRHPLPPSSSAAAAPLPGPPHPQQHPSQHAPMFNRSLLGGPAPPSSVAPPPQPPQPRSTGGDAEVERAPADSPYAELQTALYAALENNAAMLTTGDKLTLALEVLRARQLEADLVQARSNIKNIVTRSGPTPITLRAVIPTAARAGVPVGTPLDISGKILLSPANSDPQSLLLTLELHNIRAQAPAGQPEQQPQMAHQQQQMSQQQQMAQQQMGQQQMRQQQMGQQQMGQEQMGQEQMGQPQMGQPQMGQPQMGQPQMGQPQMGQQQQVQQAPHPQTEASRYATPAAPGPPTGPPPPPSASAAVEANGNGTEGEQGATFGSDGLSAGMGAAVAAPVPPRKEENEQGANQHDEITPADGAQPAQSAPPAGNTGTAGNPGHAV